MKPINIQPIEKQTLVADRLSVHSIFNTIQGEGPFAGERAVFIRLAGCNLQCPLCDTDYTQGREMRSIDSIVRTVRELAPDHRNYLVVITGGEPLRQNIEKLLESLLFSGYKVQIETNGTLFQEGLPYGLFTVICSPKAGKVHPRLIPYISAYKYVLHANQVDPEDGLPTKALDHSASPRVARPPENFAGRIYIQPVDEKDDINNHYHLEAAKASAMKFGYTLGLQIHKIINVE